jgi:protein TonB
MFEYALTSTTGQTRRIWSLPFAAALHLAVGMLLVAASYLTLEVLPGPELPEGITLYLPAAPPAPPPGPPAPRAPQVAPQAPRDPQELLQPTAVPEHVPVADPAPAPDEPAAGEGLGDFEGVPGGVPDGVWGGVGGGVPGSILGPPGGGGGTAPAPNEPLAIGGAVQAPVLIRSITPDYPYAARLARVQGRVVLRAVIDESGAIENVTVIEGNPLLVPAASDAVARWRYRPATLDGRPVRVWVLITVHFTLE